jgi:hypothetical protein
MVEFLCSGTVLVGCGQALLATWSRPSISLVFETYEIRILTLTDIGG